MYSAASNANNQNNLRVERNTIPTHSMREKRVFEVSHKRPNKRHYEKKWYSLENKKPPEIGKSVNYQKHQDQIYQKYRNQYSPNNQPNNQPNKLNQYYSSIKHQEPLKLKYLSPFERETLYTLLNQYKYAIEQQNKENINLENPHENAEVRNETRADQHPEKPQSTPYKKLCPQHKINALQVPICETADSRQFAATVRFEALSISEAKSLTMSKSILSQISEKLYQKSQSSVKSQKQSQKQSQQKPQSQTQSQPSLNTPISPTPSQKPQTPQFLQCD